MPNEDEKFGTRIIYRRTRGSENEPKVPVYTFVNCDRHLAEYERRRDASTVIHELMRLGVYLPEHPCQSCQPKSEGDQRLGHVEVNRVEGYA